MLQNKSLLITAGLATLGYFVYSKLKAADKKEVRDHIQKHATGLTEHKLNISNNT